SKKGTLLLIFLDFFFKKLQTLVASSTSNHGSVRHVSRTLWHHRRQRRRADAVVVVVAIRLHHRRRHGQRVPPPQDRRLLAHPGSLPHQHCPQVPRFHHRRPSMAHPILPQRQHAQLRRLHIPLPSSRRGSNQGSVRAAPVSSARRRVG
ncbi:Os10g0426600, partial [Oryza sativa Japonica Group]